MIQEQLTKHGILASDTFLEYVNLKIENFKKHGFNVSEDELIKFIAKVWDEDHPNNESRVMYKLDRVKVDPIKKKPKPGRNEPCPCGSGKKFKKCCLK